MSARLIDGKALAATLRARLARRVDALVARGLRPGLAVVRIGDDPASRVYVRNKIRACAETGVASTPIELSARTSEAELLARIDALNADVSIHGILVQLPLPPQLDEARVIDAIAVAKDVDGFHPANLGALMAGRPGMVPCTAAGVMALIAHAGVSVEGRHAVVIGRSNIVGKPTAQLLLQSNASVTICHSRTTNLADFARQGDVLVVAVGRPRLIGAAMIKPGACVIDVGTNRGDDGRLVGDVDFDAAREVAGDLTPVPGGVGPMTVAMLIENCVAAAERRGADQTTGMHPRN